MLNEENIKDLMLIFYALTFSTFGNILYCINNKLKIKPIYVRILYGLMGVAFYVGATLILTKEKPKLDLIISILIFIVGYYTQILIEIIEDRLPQLFDRISDKILNDNYKKKEAKNETDKTN